MIKTQIESGTFFNNGKAKVKLNGNEFYIDRNGKKVEEEPGTSMCCRNALHESMARKK
jgi:hypothetical protein